MRLPQSLWLMKLTERGKRVHAKLRPAIEEQISRGKSIPGQN